MVVKNGVASYYGLHLARLAAPAGWPSAAYAGSELGPGSC
jgi:hypothetical protein